MRTHRTLAPHPTNQTIRTGLRAGLRAPLAAAFALGCAAGPALAHADTFDAWVAGTAGALGSTGDTLADFGGGVAGAAAGFELLGVDLYGEALTSGGQNYYCAANLGADVAFDLYKGKTRLVAGLFTGPVYFHTERAAAETLDTSSLTAQQKALVNAMVPGGLASVTQAVDTYTQNEATLRQSAVGWNVARLRVELEHPIVPMLYVGLGGQVGYHFILTGDDAAAEARRQAIDDLAARYGITPEEESQLDELVGARELTSDSLDGLDWNVGAYLKFEI